MKLIPIPNYEEYRINVMFNSYKWDPQFYDNNTVSKYALVITKEEDEEIKKITENLSKETIIAEEMLNSNLKLAKILNLNPKLRGGVKKMGNYDSKKHIRLMRFDFHPTVEGKWALSEVNSDVPGGFAEASLMPQEALIHINNSKYTFTNFCDILAGAVKKKVRPNGRIMLVHCTSFSDDRQVMQCLGDKLKTLGFQIIYGAVDHLRFENKEAYSSLDGNEGKIDGIFRFTPLEWLIEIKPKYWKEYFDTVTTSCNHPIAIFAQTKRFPLVWDILEKQGASFETWKQYLPDTIEVKDLKNKEGYIFKPAYGRVGEKISIKEACVDDEFERIMQDVKKHPKQYLAQKKFNSKPLVDDNGKSYHLCIGAYSIDGKAAGYYARISNVPRIDSYASDIPVLVEGGNI